MRKMRRIKCPYYLKRNWKTWGNEWKIRIAGRKRLPNFDWKNKREDLIENYLAKATNEHCCFCDRDQVAVGTGATIEHLKPKGKFPLVAYQYNNLYNCCNQCQKKVSKYSDDILKPDELNYQFETYFEIDIHTGKILPKTTAAAGDRKKAKATISAYKLNNKDRERFRKRALQMYIDDIGDHLDPVRVELYSYRFFIEEYLRVIA